MADILPDNAAEIAVVNAINNINGRNRILAAGVVGGQNNMMNMRDRLFHAIYFQAAATYAELVPRKLQLALEFLLFVIAIGFFFTLVYVHNAFIKNPCTCLQDVQGWPREGVIRIEIIPHLAEKREIWQRVKQDTELIHDLRDSYYYNIGPQTYENHYGLKRYESILRRLGLPIRPTFAYSNESLYYYFDAIKILDSYDHPNAIQLKGDEDDQQYIVEYSLEYGHLRLSPATRKRLRIPVLTVQLDPDTNDCFGDRLARFFLKNLLGYDDLLMAAVRSVAEKEENKGYLRNVVTGEHYRFVSMWWASWSAYPAALFVMLLFTFSVSMLLRYSHHQIFVFIVDLLQMLEYNVSARFPIAPLLTVVLALVGMEAIMSEFFNDTTTAFYIILIVWIADQYDAICCHTSITKRHWLRFFYLYHFAFYAYHYRFSGQYRNLALLSSYLFIQHSMVFFFHRYELPAILAQRHVLFIARNPNGVEAAAAMAIGGEPAAFHRARLIVTRLFRQLAAQRQAQQQQQQQQAQNIDGAHAVNAEAQARPNAGDGGPALVGGVPTGGAVGAGIGPPLQQNAATAVAAALTNLRRLPVVGQWLQRHEQYATVRRVVLDRAGNGQLMHVHLQRINMAELPGLRNQATAGHAPTTTAATPNSADTPALNINSAGTSAANMQNLDSNGPAASTDVETNHGRKAPNAPPMAMATTTTNKTTTNMNDLAVDTTATETSQDTQGVTTGAEECFADAGASDKTWKLLKKQSVENLNSVTADIINTPGIARVNAETTTTTSLASAMEEIAAKSQPLTADSEVGKQLENNLPTVIAKTQTKELLSSDVGSSSLRMSNIELATTSKDVVAVQQSEQQIMNDQPAEYTNITNKIDVTTATATADLATTNAAPANAPVAGPSAGDAYQALKQFTIQKGTDVRVGVEMPMEVKTLEAAEAAVSVAKLNTMMDGITTVDFIKDDSSTTTTTAANYSSCGSRSTSHIVASGSGKTAEHTSKFSPVVTTAPTEVGNAETAATAVTPTSNAII